MSPWLPELVTDILLHLPVSSLLRFRCLSRSLCTEIDSENFVKNHLNRSIQRKTRQKLLVYQYPNNLYYADFDDDLVDAFILNKPLSHRDKFVYSSCNGLILLSNQTMDLAVWNPFTRRCKKLPLCPVQTLPGFMSHGLGYDSAHDDYKVVMILKDHNSSRVFSQVWVLSLKSEFWRSRDLEDRVNTKVGRFANGALYWACENKWVGFDLAEEVFFDIPLSSDFGPAATFRDSLVVFGGNLCWPTLHDGTVDYYLLVSDDKGGEVVGGSWRNEFTMENAETLLGSIVPPWPLAYSKNGDSILLGEARGVFWHNLENKTKQNKG